MDFEFNSEAPAKIDLKFVNEFNDHKHDSDGDIYERSVPEESCHDFQDKLTIQRRKMVKVRTGFVKSFNTYNT